MPFRILIVAALLLAWGAAFAGEANPAAMKKWADDRAALRKGRAELRAGAEASRVERAGKAAKIGLELVAKAKDLRVPGQDALFTRLAAFIDRLDPTQVADFTAAVKALPPEPATADVKPAREWTTWLSSRRAALTKPTEVLAQKAIGVKVYDIAHECLMDVLTFDPDNATRSGALGMTKVDDRWYGPKDLVLVKAGLRWDDKLGWIMAKDAKDAARYAAGEYYDLQAKRWTTLTDADAAHSTLEQGWVIQTEHLEIRGNAQLTALVQSANKLEQFYQQIFANYCGFFATGRNPGDDVRLIFGVLDHPRLRISIARNREDYKKSLPDGIDAGWSAGMWVPSADSTFFFAGPADLMFHEFTHQILDKFMHGNRAPVWVTEGSAVYTQSPTYEKGELVLGITEKNRQVMQFLLQRRTGKAMSLDTLFALDHASWRAAADPQAQYSAAGAVVQFCMEADHRKYRGDFIDFLRDSYLGETGGHPVWEYLGMSRADFNAAFEKWGEGRGEPKA